MNEERKPNPTIEESLSEFDNKVIAHPILDSVFEDLRAVVQRPAGSTIIANVGPTGASKTTLIKRLHRDLLKAMMASMEANPGHIPVIFVEAPSPDNGIFHWGDFYGRFLEAAFEPMVDKKSLEMSNREIRERRKKAGTFAALRRAVENCIRYRGIRVIIIDEAQHLVKMPNARRLQDQLDTIKSLASLAGALFVMVGTYDLLTLLNQNGQLARRTRRIHFPRYNFDRPADRQAFRNILGMFESRMPLSKAGILVSNLDYMYQGSLGCVGMLKDWLRRALSHAVEAGRGYLELEDLEATILENDSLLEILQEIRDGEARIALASTQGEELRKQLGLGRSKTSIPEQVPESEAAPKKGVGERKPVRDPVGGAA